MADITEQEKAARARRVKYALAIGSIDGVKPDELTISLLEKYANGEITIDEVKETTIKVGLNETV